MSAQRNVGPAKCRPREMSPLRQDNFNVILKRGYSRVRLRDNFFVPNFHDEKINKKKMSSSELNIANDSGWTFLMFDVCTAQSSFDDSVSKSEFFSCQKPLFRDFFVVFENSRSQIFTISTISCQLERLGLLPGLRHGSFLI